MIRDVNVLFQSIQLRNPIIKSSQCYTGSHTLAFPIEDLSRKLRKNRNPIQGKKRRSIFRVNAFELTSARDRLAVSLLWT